MLLSFHGTKYTKASLISLSPPNSKDFPNPFFLGPDPGVLMAWVSPHLRLGQLLGHQVDIG